MTTTRILALFTLLLPSSMLMADSTLHIGFGAGTACATGCAGDPNVSGGAASSAVFDLSQTSGGAGPADDPILLIIGVPNVSDPGLFSNSSIASLTSINPYPGGTTVGSPPNTWGYGTTAFGMNGSGFRGFYTSAFHGDVYSFLGLPGANNSNSFTNWSAFDLSDAGITASGFGIYVFALHATLDAQGLLNITFAGPGTIPIGSYIIGYATDPPAGGGSATFSTPFTESGLQTGTSTVVPEPASMLLLGSGLAALAARKKYSSSRRG